MYISILPTGTSMPPTINPETLEKIRSYVLTAVRFKRYAHCVRTAQTAALLCTQYGKEKEIGYFAGMSHDMSREMNKTLLIQLASQDGLDISDTEKKRPILLHGRAAAILLQKQFNITDKDILEAVRFHTSGKPDMCDLAKILYIADKIEPQRPHMTPEKINDLLALSLSLNNLTLLVLTQNIEYLKNQKKTIAPITLLFYNSLKKT